MERLRCRCFPFVGLVNRREQGKNIKKRIQIPILQRICKKYHAGNERKIVLSGIYFAYFTNWIY